MLNKLFFSILTIVIFNTCYIFCNKISDELLGVKLGTEYNVLRRTYNLAKVNNHSGIDKIYKIVYAESFGIETFFYFFKSRVYKIKVVYNKNFVDETDWENIYNQTKLNYGEYLSTVVNIGENAYIEKYIWQDENLEQILEKSLINNVLETFSIVIVDKKVETEIINISPLKKFWYKIISIF